MILRLTEGSLAPVACLEDGADICERCDTCETLEVWQELYDAVNKVVDGVTIADLRVSASGMSYSYAAGDLRKLSPGNSHENPDCLACLFVRGKDGAWRGGKFDWISSDRTKRDFSNIRTGYNGWPPVSIDAAEAYAFVIVSKDGCSRTNVCAQIEK